MNSIFVVIIGFIVAFIGYRVYAKYVDTKIMQADPKKVTPAKMYMDGVDFMPTSRNILFGYQFKSIAGAAPVIGPIIAIQWGWLPALIWILAFGEINLWLNPPREAPSFLIAIMALE
jgi:carbon starvation protein